MLPAVGQGASGLECRADDDATRASSSRSNDAGDARRRCWPSGRCCAAWAAAARCRSAPRDARRRLLTLRGVVLSPDGSRRIDATISGPAGDAEDLGRRLADDLRGRGAAELLGF